MLALSLGICEMATLLAASTPLAAKLASAEKHFVTSLAWCDQASSGPALSGRSTRQVPLKGCPQFLRRHLRRQIRHGKDPARGVWLHGGADPV